MTDSTYVKPRKQYVTPPKVDKERKPLQRKKPMRRVGKDRAKERRDAKDVTPNFLLYNPKCACGCGEDATCPQHIASGSAGRAASLFDTDLWLPSAEWCNGSEVWHDPLLWPKSKQLACKVAAIVRKFNAANALPTSIEEVVSYLQVDLSRVAQLMRERKE